MSAYRKPLAKGTAPRTRVARVRAARHSTRATTIVVGKVVEVYGDDEVRFEGMAESWRCRCAAHIDLAWLRRALEKGPVEADARPAARPDEGRICAIYPGREHSGVVADRVEIVAGTKVIVRCGSSTFSLAEDGKVRLRARDLDARGSLVARLRGGSVRLN
jgi:hypothetical protein